MSEKTTKRKIKKTIAKPKAKMGAPEKIDDEKLTALMRMKPSLDDTATFFGVSTSGIERFIKRHHNMTYSEFRDKNMVFTRFSLIRKAIEKAKGGDNVMLIFCLKNLCGWTDKHERSLDEERPIKLAYNIAATVTKNEEGVWELKS